jgi:hypothetical protein
MVFENFVLREYLDLKQEVSGDWRKLYNEELHNLYPLQHMVMMTESKRMRWVGDVELFGEVRHAYEILVIKPEGMKLFGVPRHRWVDTRVKLDLNRIAATLDCGRMSLLYCVLRNSTLFRIKE